MAGLLFFDVETSPVIAATWGLYDQNIPYQHVIQDWHIICAAWQWEGGEVQSISCKGTDDLNVVKKLHSLISSADAIVAHNGDKFDYKKFMARVLHHGLEPPRPCTMIDTLKMARNFAFTSRKLDDLGASLGIGRKIETERGLWVKAAQGDKHAIKALEAYCRGDIPPLVNLYYKLRPYVKTGYNQGLYSDEPCCPKCSGKNMIRQGTRKTVNGAYDRWQCKDCGSWAQTTPRVKKAFFK